MKRNFEQTPLVEGFRRPLGSRGFLRAHSLNGESTATGGRYGGSKPSGRFDCTHGGIETHRTPGRLDTADATGVKARALNARIEAGWVQSNSIWEVGAMSALRDRKASEPSTGTHQGRPGCPPFFAAPDSKRSSGGGR